jgi:signal transduction histidine kinase/ActR/RegA family two-component response regulator
MAFIFSTWLSRPFLAIANGSRRMGEGDLSQRVEATAGGELGEVAQAFNQMGERLKAAAIEKARLIAATERAAREVRSLYEVAHSLTTSLDLTEVLRLVSMKTTELLGTPHAQVVLWDEATQVLRLGAAHGTEAETVKRQQFRVGEGVNGLVAQTRAPLIVNDYQAFPHRISGMPELVAVIGVPLLHHGRLLGVLTSHATHPGWMFTEAHLALLTSFAAQAATAIENARLFQQEQVRRRQVEAVRAVTAEITRELNLTTLLSLITRRAVELVGAASGTVYLWDEAAQVLVPRAWHGLGEWTEAVRLRLGDGIVGMVAQRREGMIVADYRTWPHARPLVLERTGITAILAEPLLYRDRLLGVVTADKHDTGQPFTEEDRHLLRLFADQAAVGIENARLFAELNQSYHELQRAQDELIRSEKLRALGQMAAGIAHDLNNRLAAILGRVELLRLQTKDPESQQALGTLETAVTDGAHVVRRLQGFARQQPTGPLVPCDLAALVHEALEFTRPQWRDGPQRRGMTVQVRTALSAPGGLPLILGQPAEIREALTNLILNAVDAMPQGGVITISARVARGDGGHLGDQAIGQPGGMPNRPIAQLPEGQAKAGGGWVTLSVSDTGIGMPDKIRQRIFDPFFTTKGSRGTGLGLSVVYGIMERHGGHIEVTSTPGKGTTFTLHFQAAPAAALAGSEPPPQTGPPRRVLLIDDDPMVRETVASLLRSAGHTVVEADGGASGIKHLAEGSVDLVLTDLGMPEVTGWDVARAVRSQQPSLPIILLTGWGDQPIVEAGESGSSKLVDRVLGKPFRLEELLSAIANLTTRPHP